MTYLSEPLVRIPALAAAAVLLSSAALVITGCEVALIPEDRSEPITITAQTDSRPGTRASSDPDYELFRTLNNAFIADESHIFIDNPLQAEPFPDFSNGFVQYYCSGEAHVCTEEGGGIDGDQFQVFLPVSGTQALSKEVLVHSPSDNNYRIEAVHIPGVTSSAQLAQRYWLENRLYKGTVDPDQTTVEKMRGNDLMLAHNLTPVIDLDLDRRIHLHFWHSMAMVVVNLGIPDYDAQTETGFDNTSNPITAEGCSLVDMILNFTVNYSTFTNSDQAIRVSLPDREAEIRSDVAMCYLGSEAKTETVGGKQRGHHWYRYCALVPVQSKNEIGPDGFAAKLCRFSIYDPAREEDVSYIYRQDNSIMEQGRITILNLRLDQTQPDPILVSSEILPWTYAYTTDIECKEGY